MKNNDSATKEIETQDDITPRNVTGDIEAKIDDIIEAKIDDIALRPVLIGCTSRSYSSLTAKIFINHGLWWGGTPVKSCGYITYENEALKKIVQRYKQKVWRIPICHAAPADADFVAEVAACVPGDRRWLFKCGAEYILPFQALNPCNIFIRRDLRAAARSLARKNPSVDYDEACRQIRWRYDYMSAMQARFGGVTIDTSRLIELDFTEIKAAIEYCGLVFDESAALAAFDVGLIKP